MADEQRLEDTPRPRLFIALIPVVSLVAFLFIGIRFLEIAPHIPLILAAIVAALASVGLGMNWKSMQDAVVNGISMAMPAILILMAIGILIGAWVASGIVPLMVYYGLKLLSPGIFLVAACLICSVVSFATGSSWSTIGTVGVALIGVGQGLDIPLPMVAGAIVSGAYFGDKLSPLSDTTNLAPAVAGSNLFEHIRHMLYTTLPSLLIALVLYGLLGSRISSNSHDTSSVDTLMSVLTDQFNLSPWLLASPLAVIALIVLRIPALPTMLAGAFLGGLSGIWIQDMSIGEILNAMQVGYLSETGNPRVDELLSRGGLESMFFTISLILCAMAFGGLMERSGMLASIARSILAVAKSAGSLVAATVTTCMSMNIMAPDQYLSIIVPGRMYKEAFSKANLHAKNLSRCLEDAGTLTSPLVPWNTCGIFILGTLLVNPLAYLPFAFLNIINPILSLIYGFTGWTMEPAKKGDSTQS